MIELSQHIEALLLENDCVIVPGLGGFVAHYASSMRVEEEGVFLPPTRVIGFNPQLKMNDGLLAQSYMAAYGTDFSDATKIVNRTVSCLLAVLHENGKAELPNVGELRYSIHDTYGFIPYDNKLTTPCLYGLDSFEMQELAALPKPNAGKAIPFTPVVQKKKRHEFSIGSSYLLNAVAMVAIVALFFMLSTPIENTEVLEANYARMLPADLFARIENQSLAVTPVVIRQKADAKKAPNADAGLTQATSKKKVVPVVAKEVKVSRQPAVASKPVIASEVKAKTMPAPPVVEPKREAIANVQPIKTPYHIIVASVGTEKDAKAMAQNLVVQGHAGAKAIIGDGKMRVSIRSCATQTEAYRMLNKIRQDKSYQGAWVLKKN